MLGGMQLTRRGNIYYFVGVSSGVGSPGEGDDTEELGQSVQGGGFGSDLLHYFLTLPSVFHLSSFSSLASVHNVSCSNHLSLHLCSGSLVSIRRFKSSMELLEERDLHHHLFVLLSVDPAVLLKSLGLQGSVSLLPYTDGSQFLALSYSREALDLLLSYLSIINHSGCLTVEYRPVSRSVQDLSESLVEVSRSLCSSPLIQPGRLLVHSKDPAEDLRLLTQLDMLSRPLRLRLLIMETSRSATASIVFEDLKTLLSQLKFPSVFEVDFSLSGNISSLRHVDLVLTESEASWSNQQADRVEGAIAIQDGARVRSIDTRNVGLSVHLKATRLRQGLRGNLTISDSILSREIVVSVNCSAEVVIVEGEAVELCRSFIKRSSDGIGFTGLSLLSSIAEYRVFAWIMPGTRYKLPVRLDWGEKE